MVIREPCTIRLIQSGKRLLSETAAVVKFAMLQLVRYACGARGACETHDACEAFIRVRELSHFEGDARADDEGAVGDPLLEHEAIPTLTVPHPDPRLARLGILSGGHQVDVMCLGFCLETVVCLRARRTNRLPLKSILIVHD
jgi:hypothetical protein